MIKFILKLIDRAEQCLVVLNKIYQLLLLLSEQHNLHATASLQLDTATPCGLPEQSDPEMASYTDEELLTVKEAMDELGISRWKLTDMRNKKELTTISRGKDVRLIRREVEAARLWYSVPKGKC